MVNNDGLTPIEIAEQEGREARTEEEKKNFADIVELLQKYKGKVLWCEWV